MPDFCAAYGCSNERSLQTRNRGITFHKFPKSRERRRQWELALRRDGFMVNDRSLLCSEHFRNEDFDKTGQTVRLKAGTVPQIFKVPAHYQRLVAMRSTTASRRAEENLPMDLHQDQPPPDVPQAATGERQKSQKTKASDHLYALPSCPNALTAKVDATLKTVRKLQRDKLNVQRMMRAVCVDAPGGPENLLLKSVSRPQPKDGEVLIKVYATALNRADLLQRQGLYPPPPGESDIIGLEVAGTVETLGPGLKGGWKTGERVMALLSGGGYAEYVVVPEGLIMAAPPALTLYQAAAIPEAWLTAFQLLVLIAEVKEGEVVLIHAGASGVGTAAVQLVRLFGAVPVVTAGSPEKLKLAETLGAVAGFNYKEQSFAQGVKDFTGGKGADVILDCIGGSNWEQNVDCLATDGRWVLYGLMGGRRVEGDLLGRLLFKRGRLLCSLLRSRSLQYKADLVQAFTQRALPCFSEQQPVTLKPVIDSTLSLDDIAQAHRHMEANRNMGKIVISVIPECQENK